MTTNFYCSEGVSVMEKCDCGVIVNYTYFNPITKKKTCFVCAEKKHKYQEEVKNEK